MQKIMPIPDSPEAVTTAWLTHALRSTGTVNQTEVASFKTRRIGEKEGFTGHLVHFEIDYARSGPKAPTSRPATPSTI